MSLDVAAVSDSHGCIDAMRWFRANTKFGSRLALFALAVQIVLSFGHIHLNGFNGKARSVAAANSLAVPQADTRGKLPSPLHSQDIDGYCAICASIHLASTALASAPPQLIPPSVTRRTAHSNIAASTFISPRRALFQPRAPPLA